MFDEPPKNICTHRQQPYNLVVCCSIRSSKFMLWHLESASKINHKLRTRRRSKLYTSAQKQLASKELLTTTTTHKLQNRQITKRGLVTTSGNNALQSIVRNNTEVYTHTRLNSETAECKEKNLCQLKFHFCLDTISLQKNIFNDSVSCPKEKFFT